MVHVAGLTSSGSKAFVGVRWGEPQERLEKLSREGAPERYPDGLPDKNELAECRSEQRLRLAIGRFGRVVEIAKRSTAVEQERAC